MRRAASYLAALVSLAVAGTVLAEAPDRSARPALRPSAPVATPAPVVTPATPVPVAPVAVPEGASRVNIVASAQAPGRSLRPPARPGGAPAPRSPPAPTATPISTAPPAPSAALPDALAGLRFNGGVASSLAVPRSLRPALRPDGLVQQVRASATRQTPGRVAQPGRRGALCGQRGLVGDRLEPIPGRIQGCGIAEPVRLREVDGITLSTPATINCTAATALQTWVRDSLVPAVGRTGGGVSSLRVVASYACRTRNNQPGARISEHGRGNAIDIAGIGLANGTELTVLTGWRDRRQGQILRAAHSGACGPFGTVLGPNSDRFHQDHFHFDVASYRSGPYCR